MEKNKKKKFANQEESTNQDTGLTNQEMETDIYSLETRQNLIDKDAINTGEDGFMEGYINPEKIGEDEFDEKEEEEE